MSTPHTDEPFDDDPAPTPATPAVPVVSDEPFEDDIDQATVHEPEVLDPELPKEQALARRSDSLLERAKSLRIVDGATFDQAAEIIQTLKDGLRDWRDYWYGSKDKPGPVKRNYDAYQEVLSKFNERAKPMEDAITAISDRYSAFKREQDRLVAEEKARREKEALRVEQERLRKEAEARAAEAKRLEEEAMKASTREEAAVLEEQAAATAVEATQLKLDAATAKAPVMHVEPAVSTKGKPTVSEQWTWELFDKKALVQAVAAGKVSLEALEINSSYFTRRAGADRDTWDCPGVRFYDKGRVSSKRRR